MSTAYAPIICLVALSLVAVLMWRSPQPEGAGAPLPSPPAAGAAAEDNTQPAEPVSLAGYEPLDMNDVFVKPAGPKGLQYTAGTAALDGRKVRIRGWMVRHLHDDPRVFLLNTQPITLNMSEYGLADDLPPWAVHVILAGRDGWAPVWTPRPLEVCGTLELGPRQERDGRISHIRLKADHVIDQGTAAPLSLLMPIGLQHGRLASARFAPEPPAVPDRHDSLSSESQNTTTTP